MDDTSETSGATSQNTEVESSTTNGSGETSTQSAESTVETEGDLEANANVPAATEFAPSGAPIQPAVVDLTHPAVDSNPRKDTTVLQNKIDFNDPTISGQEAVERALGMSAATEQ